MVLVIPPKPTRDDKYSVALHGVKKKPKRVVSARDKEIQNKFRELMGLAPSSTTTTDPTSSTATTAIILMAPKRDPNSSCFPILRIISRLRDTTLSVTLTQVVFRFF
jgi:hypothetical protein